MHTFTSKSIVLDPNVKHLYCRTWWECEQYKAGMKQLEDVLTFISPSFINTILSWNQLLLHQVSPVMFKVIIDMYSVSDFGLIGHLVTSGTTANTPPAHRYGRSFLFEAVQSLQQEKATGSPCDELKMYFESDIKQTSDVISHWGVGRFVASWWYQ